MKQDQAEVIALQALGFVAGNDELAPVFLTASGADPHDLATRAQDPFFLASVVDFLLGDEALVLAFCDATGLAYDVPMRARMALPGGDVPDWT